MASAAGGAAGGGADLQGEQWHLRTPVEGNPIVFFDISIGGQPAGRLRMELWKDLVPKTAENFRQFCTGEFMRAGKPTGYKGVAFHRLIKGFMMQGGDFMHGDGTGCLSIYGSRFPDENFSARHTGPGLLSMANSGRDANGCQFFITCAPCDWLDGKHVAFGRVLEDAPPHGLFLLRKCEHVATGPQSRPRIPILIAECGEM